MQRPGNRLRHDQRVVGKGRVRAVMRDRQMPRHIRLRSEWVRAHAGKHKETVMHYGKSGNEIKVT